MKNIFLFIVTITLTMTTLKSQEVYEFSDVENGIKCQAFDFGYYILLDVENLGKSEIYIPDIFFLMNDCNRMECYLSNYIGQYPIVDEIVSVRKVEPQGRCGFIIREHGNINKMKVYLGYSKKEIKSDKVINIVGLLDYKIIPHSN